MTQEKKNNIVLLESSPKFFRGKVKQYDQIFIWDGQFPRGEKLPTDFLNVTDHILSNYKAGRVIDSVFSQYLENGTREVFNEVLSDEKGCLFAKKIILGELARIFYSFILAERFKERYGKGQTIDFVPRIFSYSLYRTLSLQKGLLPENIHIPGWHLKKMKYWEIFKNRIFSVALFFYPIVISLTMRGKPGLKKKYTYGINLFESWIATYGPALRYRMDFLESADGVNPQSAMYFINHKISEHHLKMIKTSGYDCCYFKEMIKNFDRREYFNGIYLSAKRIVQKMTQQDNKKALITESYLRLLRSYIAWEIFSNNYEIKTSLFVQDPSDVAGALLRKKHAVDNVFIYYSTQYDVLAREDMDTFTEIYYGLIIADVMISSRMSNDYFKRNANPIGRYEECGVLWADIASKIKQDPLARQRIKNELGIPEDKIIIGFFSPGVGRSGFLNNEESIQMIEDIYQFLEKNKEYYIVFKPRKMGKFKQDSELSRKFNELINHKRVCDASARASHYKAYHLMGVCDLVIGGFGSSVPLEAAAAGIKSVCYVPPRFNNRAIIINTFPRFCAGDYKQLEEYAHYWLHQCNEDDFRQFQNTYIRKHVDSFCDGQAMKRLQSALEKNEIKNEQRELSLVGEG